MKLLPDGKVGLSGHWEPGLLNRVLGRQLECGQHAWYRRAFEWVIYDLRGAFISFWFAFWRKTATVEVAVFDGTEEPGAYPNYYDFYYRLTRRQADKLRSFYIINMGFDPQSIRIDYNDGR